MSWLGERRAGGQGYCECFSSRETEVRPSRLWLGKRPQTIRPQCHGPPGPSFQGLLLPAGAVCAPFGSGRDTARWWKDGGKTRPDASANRHVCDWARNDNLVPPSRSRSSRKTRLVSTRNGGWVGEAQRRFWFIVGFLAERARGLSSVPTLDTERMWRCKVRSSHRSHRNLDAHSGAKLAGQRPRGDLLSAATVPARSSLLFSWEYSSWDKPDVTGSFWVLSPPKNPFSFKQIYVIAFTRPNQCTTEEAKMAERLKPRASVNG